MPWTRDDVRASVRRAGDAHWEALVAHHEDAYPASRPTPGDVCRGEAERLNEAGYGDQERYELVRTEVARQETTVTLTHVLRDRQRGAEVVLPAFTDYE